MKITAAKWLNSKASLAGTIACGLQRPNGKRICQSVDDVCSESKMEEVLAFFESIQTTLASSGVAPLWSTWRFEQGSVRYALRADGWLLGMLVRPDSEASEKLDHHTREFLSLEKLEG
jgi:hypothetical protein